ncbi:MAG: hypothetical protein HZA22_10010 [Nitrospirae bacterium]|nr:hypothetical protein [Nitrospirota bacterium]
MEDKSPKRNPWKAVIVLLGSIVLIESFVIYNTYCSITGSFGLPAYSFFNSEGHVRAYGSWIPETTHGVIADIPINSTTIECYESLGICIEARAFTDKKVDNRILTEAYLYDIKSWSPQEIIAVRGSNEIRIDRVKEVVTFIEMENVEVEGARSLYASAHLGNGEDAIKAAKDR